MGASNIDLKITHASRRAEIRNSGQLCEHGILPTSDFYLRFVPRVKSIVQRQGLDASMHPIKALRPIYTCISKIMAVMAKMG